MLYNLHKQKVHHMLRENRQIAKQKRIREGSLPVFQVLPRQRSLQHLRMQQGDYSLVIQRKPIIHHRFHALLAIGQNRQHQYRVSTIVYYHSILISILFLNCICILWSLTFRLFPPFNFFYYNSISCVCFLLSFFFIIDIFEMVAIACDTV